MGHDNKAVLACIDGSSASEAVCDYASWISQKIKAPLTLLHSIEHINTPQGSDYSGAIGLGSREGLLNELVAVEQQRSRLLVEKGQLMLKAAQERATVHGAPQIEICQRHGVLSESLIALEEKTRVIVLGIRGETHDNGQFQGVGNKLESVVRSVHKPILVVNRAFTPPKKVMLAYDGSPACKKALEMICSSALFKETPCHVVHVGEQGETLLREAAEALRQASIETTTAQLSGKIETALARAQAEENIDLMLMGGFTHHRFREFLWGSFTAKMLAHTHKPLLLLR